MLLTYRFSAEHTFALLYKCSGFICSCWVGGGGARGWVEHVLYFLDALRRLWEMALLFCMFIHTALTSKQSFTR